MPMAPARVPASSSPRSNSRESTASRVLAGAEALMGRRNLPHTMPPNCLSMSALLRVTMGSPLTGGLLA